MRKVKGQQLDLNIFEFYNSKAPVLVQGADIRVGKDLLGFEEIPANNCNSYTVDDVNGFTYTCFLTTGGIYVEDQAFFNYFGLYNSTSGNYTGDTIPTGTYGLPMVHPVSGLFYYAPSAVGSDFYIFDVINQTNTKKTMSGVATVRRILYDAINDKVIIVCLNGIAVYDTVLDTFTYYTNTSGNYTGTTLPSTGLIHAAIKDDLLFMARSADGVYKFDLTNEVSSKYTTSEGLASNSPNSLEVYNNYLYISQAVAATPFSRLEITTEAVTHFGNATANYSGDRIPSVNAQSIALRRSSLNAFLQLKQSGNMSLIEIDASTDDLTLGLHPNALGLAITTTLLIGSNLMNVYHNGSNYQFSFTGTSIGIQMFQHATTNPVKIQFNEYGLQYVSDSIIPLSGNLLNPNSLAYRGFVESLTDALDARTTTLERATRPDFIELTDSQSISTLPNFSTVYYYSGATPINISISVNSGASHIKILFTQLGAGSITISGIIGTTATVNQYDIIELFPQPASGQFIGRLIGSGSGGGVGTPQEDDQELTPSVTSGDEASTGIALTNTPTGFLQVVLNGEIQILGNGVKTKKCYFSSDGGITAKSFATVAAGDILYWNGVIAGYDLDTDDVISIYYI